MTSASWLKEYGAKTATCSGDRISRTYLPGTDNAPVTRVHVSVRRFSSFPISGFQNGRKADGLSLIDQHKIKFSSIILR